MLISGIQKFTVLDFPERTACIVFTPGCNFRCGYCHNPEFVLPELLEKIRSSFIPETAFFNFLKEREGLLDGVVITGGEPTIMPDLESFIGKIKAKGFLVKLDTNGSNSKVLAQLLQANLLDYVAMDIKTSLEKYRDLVGPGVNPEEIRLSTDILKHSSVPYEFRSTILRETHTQTEFEGMAELVAGADRLYLQTFRPGHVLNPDFKNYQPFSESEMRSIADFFGTHVKQVTVRS